MIFNLRLCTKNYNMLYILCTVIILCTLKTKVIRIRYIIMCSLTKCMLYCVRVLYIVTCRHNLLFNLLTGPNLFGLQEIRRTRAGLTVVYENNNKYYVLTCTCFSLNRFLMVAAQLVTAYNRLKKKKKEIRFRKSYTGTSFCFFFIDLFTELSSKCI